MTKEFVLKYKVIKVWKQWTIKDVKLHVRQRHRFYVNIDMGLELIKSKGARSTCIYPPPPASVNGPTHYNQSCYTLFSSYLGYLNSISLFYYIKFNYNNSSDERFYIIILLY